MRGRFGVLITWIISALLPAVRCLAQTTSAPQVAPRSAAEYAQSAGRTVAVLASDSLAGRGYGPADGARKAAHYLAGRFRELGLEPVGDSAGRSYYQHFTLPINTFSEPVALLTDKRGAWRPGTEFIVAPDCPPTNGNGRVLALDTALFGLDSGLIARRLRPRSLAKCLLVLRAQDEKRLAKLPLAARRWVASARAVLVREPRKLTASVAQRQGPQAWFRVLDSAWTRAAPVRRATVYAGTQFEAAYPAMNVVGRLRGTAPNAADSVLFVTAHYDHLGQQGPEVTFYGANDNASGTAMLLELARAFTGEHRPKHDIIFIAFGAEEAGLVGSEWCANHPPVPLTRIRFLLNLDLEGFGDKGATVVNGKLHPTQYQLLTAEPAAQAAANSPSFPWNARGKAANSDHFPFSERGVPAFFVYSLGGSGYYHDVRDRPATLDLESAYSLYWRLRTFVENLDAQP